MFAAEDGWKVKWTIYLSARTQILLEGSLLTPSAKTWVNGLRINNFTGHTPEPPWYQFHSTIYKLDFFGGGQTRYLHRGDTIEVNGRLVPLSPDSKIALILFQFACTV